MRLFRKVQPFLGSCKRSAKRDDHDDTWRNPPRPDPIPRRRKGFSVPVDHSISGPVLAPCNGDGGVQGLRWYTKQLKIDEDGDIADGFLCEVVSDTFSLIQESQKPQPRFQLDQNVKLANVRKQVITPEGQLQHIVQCQDREILV